MQEKFNTLSKKNKIQLIRISVFGNEYISVSSVMEFFEFDEEEKNKFLEFLYYLKSDGWIELDKEKYKLTKEGKEFIYTNNPPRVENSRYIIELFLRFLNPVQKPLLSKDIEILLLRALVTIKGVSVELALLNDYYAQYLNTNYNNKSAANFFELAVQIQEKANENDVRLCNYYNHLAETYMLLDQKSKALDTVFKSIHLAYQLSINDHVVLVFSYSLISTIYFKQKEYNLSYENIIKAIDIAEQNKLTKNQMATLYYEASIISSKANKGADSKRFIESSKQFLGDENAENKDLHKMIALQSQYVSLINKLDSPVIKLTKTRYLFLAVILIIALIVFLTIII